MPKKYQMNVQSFVVNKRVEGHSWNEIAELVKQEFDLDPPPSRRQMTKWVDQRTLPRRVVVDSVDKRDAMTNDRYDYRLTDQQTADMAGGVILSLLKCRKLVRDFGFDVEVEYNGWKFLLLTLEKGFGSDNVMRFINRYYAEKGGDTDGT